MKSFYYCEHMQSYAGVDNETINSHKKIALSLVTRLKNIPHPFLSQSNGVFFMSDYGVFWTLFKQHFSCINFLSINYFPTLTLHYRYLLFFYFILLYFYHTIPLFLSCNFIFVYIDV